jgi:hypothetical protein
MDFISRHGTQSKLYDLRSELSSDKYVYWLTTNVQRCINNLVYIAYTNTASNGLAADSWIKFETKGLSSAMSIKKIYPEFDVNDLVYFQMQLSEKLKNHGYIVNLSEVKQHTENEHSLIIYMKPSFKLPLINDKSDQLYGNIHSEIRIKNGALVFFNIIIHRYRDHRFDDGKSFDELVTALFKI